MDSYGLYQFYGQDAKDAVMNSKFASKFENLEHSTKEFNKMWKDLVQEDLPGMTEMMNSHYDKIRIKPMIELNSWYDLGSRAPELILLASEMANTHNPKAATNWIKVVGGDKLTPESSDQEVLEIYLKAWTNPAIFFNVMWLPKERFIEMTRARVVAIATEMGITL